MKPLTYLPQVKEKVVCNVEFIEELTEGKEYEVVYRGGNHSAIIGDDGYTVNIVEKNYPYPRYVHMYMFTVAAKGGDKQ